MCAYIGEKLVLSQYCRQSIKAMITLVLYLKPLISHWLFKKTFTLTFQEPSWQLPPASYLGRPSPWNSWVRPRRPVQKGETMSGQQNDKYDFRFRNFYLHHVHGILISCMSGSDPVWGEQSFNCNSSFLASSKLFKQTVPHPRKFNQWYPSIYSQCTFEILRL